MIYPDPSIATSAAGSMHRMTRSAGRLPSLSLAGIHTSTGQVLPEPSDQEASRVTTSSMWPASTAAATASIGTQIGELRRLSGLTWDQLARVFGVSRRSLHFWASGKEMAASNEEHLNRLLSIVRQIDRGSARENREALLSVGDDNILPIDLLAKRAYDQALKILASAPRVRSFAPFPGPGNPSRPVVPAISVEAVVARTPRPPEELVDALQDRIHPASGRLLKSSPVGIARRK